MVPITLHYLCIYLVSTLLNIGLLCTNTTGEVLILHRIQFHSGNNIGLLYYLFKKTSVVSENSQIYFEKTSN